MYEDRFCETLRKAFQYVENNDAIITLGIEPSRPDTGYGYIQLGEGSDVKKVISFKEKPDQTTAEIYLKNKYVWNSGMFVWSIKTLINAFELHTDGIINLLNQSPEKYNTVLEQEYIDDVYPATKKISIDYAILEKAENVYCLPCDIGWADLGTWASLYSYSIKDKSGNVIHNNKHHIVQTENCIIKTKKDKKIVIKGLKDFIIVDEEDALLIYPITSEQEIKEASSKLK
jgi:mannose-1-phosphate guanylyltransferase